MDEKKFSWRDIFLGAFLLTVMLRVMLGILVQVVQVCQVMSVEGISGN